jgi:ABC-type nickel/cobalt efflux system permease component RcnA
MYICVCDYVCVYVCGACVFVGTLPGQKAKRVKALQVCLYICGMVGGFSPQWRRHTNNTHSSSDSNRPPNHTTTHTHTYTHIYTPPKNNRGRGTWWRLNNPTKPPHTHTHTHTQKQTTPPKHKPTPPHTHTPTHTTHKCITGARARGGDGGRRDQ